MYEIAFKRLSEQAHVPQKAHEDDAGFDLYAAEDVTLKPHGGYAAIATDIAIALPPMTEAQVRPRSGLAVKYGVTVLNSPGTIDAGYRGEIKVPLINHGEEPFVVTAGMRVAQLVIAPVWPAKFHEVESLDETERGEGGFGSTGTR